MNKPQNTSLNLALSARWLTQFMHCLPVSLVYCRQRRNVQQAKECELSSDINCRAALKEKTGKWWLLL